MIDTKKIYYKKVNNSDVQELRDLAHDTFIEAFGALNSASDMAIYVTKAFDIKTVLSELNNPNSEFFFVMYNKKVIGYLKINEGPAQTEDNFDDAIEVERIYILPSFQGMKIGEELINKAINIAKRKDKKLIWLGVWDQNKNAIRFYQKHGFKAFNTHNFMLGNDEQTDVLMRRYL